MRVVHAWVDNDECKLAMALKYNAKKRLELDGRDSDQAKVCAFETNAEHNNHNSNNPNRTRYPDLHPTLAEDVDISWEAVKNFGPITGTKVNEMITKMRCTLNLIIAKWEQSGNGDGTLDDEEDSDEFREDGGGRNLPNIGGMDDRANFLHGECLSHLYLWQKSKEHEVFHSVLQRISGDANLTGGGVKVGGVKRGSTKKGSTGAGGANKRKHDDLLTGDLTGEIRKTSHALQNYNIEMMTNSLRDLENILLDTEDKEDELEADDDATDKQIQRQKKRVTNATAAIKQQEERLAKYLKEVEG
jgi:hypothetical protein